VQQVSFISKEALAIYPASRYSFWVICLSFDNTSEPFPYLERMMTVGKEQIDQRVSAN